MSDFDLPILDEATEMKKVLETMEQHLRRHPLTQNNSTASFASAAGALKSSAPSSVRSSYGRQKKRSAPPPSSQFSSQRPATFEKQPMPLWLKAFAWVLLLSGVVAGYFFFYAHFMVK